MRFGVRLTLPSRQWRLIVGNLRSAMGIEKPLKKELIWVLFRVGEETWLLLRVSKVLTTDPQPVGECN